VARTQAGIPLPGIDVCIRDEQGHDIPFDGHTMGDLYVRGLWVIDPYYQVDHPDSWLPPATSRQPNRRAQLPRWEAGAATRHVPSRQATAAGCSLGTDGKVGEADPVESSLHESARSVWHESA